MKVYEQINLARRESIIILMGYGADFIDYSKFPHSLAPYEEIYDSQEFDLRADLMAGSWSCYLIEHDHNIILCCNDIFMGVRILWESLSMGP